MTQAPPRPAAPASRTDVRPLRRASALHRARVRQSERWEAFAERRPGMARLVSRARRYFSPVTGAGWALLLVVVAAAVAGRAGGWHELSLISLAGACLWLVALLFAVGRSRYDVQLHFPNRRVGVGDEADGEVLVRSLARRRMLPVRIEIPVGSSAVSFVLPSLGPDAVHRQPFRLPTTRRAAVLVGPVKSVRGDALGLIRRDVTWTDAVEVFIHPRTVSLHGAAPGFLRDLEGRSSRELSNNDVSFHALREYVPGDDRRYVHWRTSARTGRLMVRQFEETRRSHLAVVMSTALGDYADDEEFELAISAAASFGLQAMREDRDLTILTSTTDLTAVTPVRMLDAMTTLDLTEREESVSQLAQRTSRHISRASVVMMVVGSMPGLNQLRRAATNFPLDARILMVRAVPAAETSVRTMSPMMTVVTVGDLEHLPRALREAARR